MAKYLDKDPEVYARERDGFLRDLKHFHETRGTPFRRAPKLTGHPIDLYLLYSLVTGRGGWIKVNYRNQWSELFEALKIPVCVNASIALKQIYLRHLDRWEKVHFLGEEADRGSDDDEESRHKRWSARALHSVPLSYNYNQHCVTELTREYNNLSTNIYKKSDYDRLGLSLISPLPNEQDFAINVCTLLSNDGKHTLKLEKHPRILNYLLAHAGVFNHGSLRRLFMHSYLTIRKQAIHNFWRDAINNEEYLDLTVEPNSNSTFSKSSPKSHFNHLNNCPNTTAGTSCRTISNSSRKTSKDFNDNTNQTKRTQSGDTANSSSVQSETYKNLRLCGANSSSGSINKSGSLREDSGHQQQNNDDSESDLFAAPNIEDDEDCVIFGDEEMFMDGVERKRRKWERSDTDRELFNLGRNLGTRDYMGQRVLQVATILRNLSFIEENVPTLSSNRCFIRFMLLCTASRWNQLQNLGLDMLGNIASEILVRDLNTDRLSNVLLKLVSDGLQTEDRHWCISALEVLNKLSQNAKNEDTLLRVLEPEVYKRVCSFLTIHDVMLLIYTLECLYSLSSLGERSCNFIVSNIGVIDTLVSLVTVEGKSYGPKACIGMKLVETVTGAVQQTQPTSPSTQTATSNTNTTIVATAVTSTVATSSVAASLHTISAPVATPVSIAGVTTGPGGSTFSSGRLTATTLGAVVVNTTPVKSAPLKGTSNAAASSASPTPPITPPPVSIKPSPGPKSSLPASNPNNPFATQASSNPIITAQQLVQQQHAHQQAIQENEQFALTWLRTTYEPCAILGNTRVDSQELYKHYVTSCQRIGRKGVIAPLHFPRCVRSVFGGTVGPNPAKPPGSSDAQFYDGIKVRVKPLLIPQATQQPTQKNTPSSSISSSKTATATNKTNGKANSTASKANNSSAKASAASSSTVSVVAQPSSPSSVVSSVASNNLNSKEQPSPASPILKAQLSAPPKQQQQQQRDSNISPTNVTNDKSQVKSHPHLSQALMASTSTPNSSTTTLTNNGKSASAASSSSSVSSEVRSAESTSSGTQQQGNSTSLIKSLLATKVNNNNVVSMQATEQPQVVTSQVAARQRLLAQQNQQQNQTSDDQTKPKFQQISLKRSCPALTSSRLNGARQLFPSTTITNTDNSSIPDTNNQSSAVSSSHSSSTSLQHMTVSSSRREPPQPPPPPLVALAGINNHSTGRKQDLCAAQQLRGLVENEDSDSMGNNSMASSTGPAGMGCVSSTEDGDNSLASFDGLINGIASVEQHDTIMLDSNDSDDGDDTTNRSSHVVIKKPLMLADLLEKKVDNRREPPGINGILSKELRIGEKGLQLIDKVLACSLDSSSDSPPTNPGPIIDQVDGASDETDPPKGKKRPAADDINETPTFTKKMLMSSSSSSTMNSRRIAIITSPASVDNSSNSNDNEDLNSGRVSTAAAKLFADIAADILEDEDDDDEVIPAAPRREIKREPVDANNSQRQVQVVQQSNATAQRQVIVSSQSPQTVQSIQSPVLASGTQLKTHTGQTVIVQNTQQVCRPQLQQQPQVIMQQGPSGQILLSQTSTGQLGQLGQMQLVATGQSGGQPTQYVIQTTGGSGAQNFVVAQPQTAVVHGQQQTVLVAQTTQQVGGQGGKTIIILQPTQVQQMQQQIQQVQQVQQHVQKVVMGPHGQQMVVTTPVTRSSTITTTQGTITLSAAPQPQTTQPSNIGTNNTVHLQKVAVQNTSGPIVNNDNVTMKCVVTPVVMKQQTVVSSSSAASTSSVVTTGTVTSTSTTSAVTTAPGTVKSAQVKKKATVQTVGKETLFICEWANCQVDSLFKSANQVFMHVCEEHCQESETSATEEFLCQWDRCDNMKRKRFSLMTHIQDKHCNLESMKASLIKRKQAMQSGKSEPAAQSPPTQQHPGYAPDAAYHAIKRHALEFVNPKELQDDNEGPVTKSIRLTASLILRNLVIYSTNCRRFLKPYEPHLANVALSNVESSRTIAQVLYDMNDSPHHHHTSSSSR